MSIERFWIDARGPNRYAIRRAGEWMISVLPQGSVGLVVVPNKAALTGDLADEQPKLARALDHHGTMSGGGATIALMTDSTEPILEPSGPAMVLQANMSLLNLVEATPGVTKILAIPWAKADIELWINLWLPRKIPIAPTPARR